MQASQPDKRDPETHRALADEGGPIPGPDQESPNGPDPELLAALYRELKDIAAGYLRRERKDHTLQATALVHEAWLRLSGQETGVASRERFLPIAATAMRRVLVDHARARGAHKRAGQRTQRTTISAPHEVTPDPIDVIALDECLEELSKLHPRQARVVELRFFAGLTVDETAAVLGASRSTIEADWRMARAWLIVRLKDRT